jgi:YVTN family beta-propeller protein
MARTTGRGTETPGNRRSRSSRRQPSRRRVRWDLIALLAIAAVVVVAGVGFGVLAAAKAIRGQAVGRSADSQSATASVSAAGGSGTTTAPAAGPPSALPAVSTEPSWTPGPGGQLVQRAAIFKTVPAPKGLAITPDNKEVWVTALVTKPSIGIYDPLSGTSRGEVNLGKSGAVEVTFNRAGTLAYASQMQTHLVYEIDVAARKVRRKFNTGSPWTKIVMLSPDETKLYAANWSGDDVSEIDVASGKLLRRIRTADTPRGLYITPDGKKLYVACFGEQTLKGVIQVFDLATGKGTTIGKGRAMRHMVADEPSGRLFTSDLGANCIWVTDLKTDKTTLFAKTDNKPNTIDISPDGRVLFVSNRGANNPKSYYEPGPEWGSVLLLDTRTGKPLDAIIGGNQCTALEVSADGTLLAFSDFIDGKLRVYRVPPTEVLLAGKGGFYQAHLRKVRKDGKLLQVTGPSSGSAE